MVRTLINVLHNITQHPLTERRKSEALARFLAWQLQRRICDKPRVIKYVNDSVMLLRRRQASASAILYTGLLEFEDMSFLLHCLSHSDLFVDVGANVGAYTVLAGKVCRADCLSYEPVPATFVSLLDNLALNDLKVEARNIALGKERGELLFTTKRDCTNHALRPNEQVEDAIRVPVERLDEVVGDKKPTLIKIDVEGFETQVVAGAHNVLSDPSLLAVIMELNGQGKKYGFDEQALHEKMLGYGFQTFAYDPFQRNLMPKALTNHGNTLYIRNADQVRTRLSSAPAFQVLDQII